MPKVGHYIVAVHRSMIIVVAVQRSMILGYQDWIHISNFVFYFF